jgi:hypothetical protein
VQAAIIPANEEKERKKPSRTMAGRLTEKFVNGRCLEDDHVRGAETFATRIILDIELNALPLCEFAVAGGVDGAEVDENVLAIFLRDEAEAFGGVKPLDRSGRSHF